MELFLGFLVASMCEVLRPAMPVTPCSPCAASFPHSLLSWFLTRNVYDVCNFRSSFPGF